MSEAVRKELLAEKQLVTFALFSYNQEEYIREAIEGAFSQTYEPLQIIISDDCSTDKTFEKITQLTQQYVGSHKIILNRNVENMGISRHVDLVDRMASGVLVVHAAGDDISLPDRVKIIFQKWSACEKPPSLIMSNAFLMDRIGNIGNCIFDRSIMDKIHFQGDSKTYMLPAGQTMAVTRQLMEVFPSVKRNIIAEDVILHRRAASVNGVFYVSDILVKYRIHEKNSSKPTSEGFIDYVIWRSVWILNRIQLIYQYIDDMTHIQKLTKELQSNLKRQIIILNYELIVMRSGWLRFLIYSPVLIVLSLWGGLGIVEVGRSIYKKFGAMCAEMSC